MSNDSRMFPGSILYCEGRHKPIFRGQIHALGVVILCPYWFCLAMSYTDTWSEIFSICVYFMGLTFCWASSALYHVKNWTLDEEIFLQRIDHCAIFICLACSVTPLIIMLHQESVIYSILPLFILTWCCCVYGIWHIFNKKHEITIPAGAIILSLFPYYLFVGNHLTNVESLLGLTSISIFAIAAFLYAKRTGNLFPNIFGFHEVFHCLTILAAYLKYSMYLSMLKNIASRCNIENSHEVLHNIANLLFGSSDVCSSIKST